MYWYVSALGFWEERLTPIFKVDRSTIWWWDANLEAGTRIQYDGQVLAATQVGGPDVYPDFFRVGHPRVASVRFRDIVEKLEPGVHQFSPVRLTRKSGHLVDPPYFLLNVAQAFDCIVLEKSDLEWREKGTPGPYGEETQRKLIRIKSLDGLVLRKEAIEGRHMFRSEGQPPLGGCLFFSDELMTAVKKARLQGVFSHPTRGE